MDFNALFKDVIANAGFVAGTIFGCAASYFFQKLYLSHQERFMKNLSDRVFVLERQIITKDDQIVKLHEMIKPEEK
jgi:ABC-type dipeptide/oligopeptide/nickel transport system ATPase subunit